MIHMVGAARPSTRLGTLSLSKCRLSLGPIDSYRFIKALTSDRVHWHQRLPRPQGAFLRVHGFPFTFFQSQYGNVGGLANADGAEIVGAAQKSCRIDRRHFHDLPEREA